MIESLSDTVILQVAVAVESSALAAVIVAVPFLMPLTTPASVTVTIEVSELDHFTPVFVEAPLTVAFRVQLPSTFSVSSLLSRLIVTGSFVTVILQVTDSPSASTFSVVSPFASPLMVRLSPSLETLAIELSETDRLTSPT